MICAGRGQRQLWHGPEATAFATFRPGEWAPVWIEVAGSRATVSVGSIDTPDRRPGAGLRVTPWKG